MKLYTVKYSYQHTLHFLGSPWMNKARVCTTSYISYISYIGEKTPIFLYRKPKRAKTSYIWPSLAKPFFKKFIKGGAKKMSPPKI